MLITANRDRPGMLAVITGVLAANDINISYMSMGRDKTGGTGISVVNVDEPITPKVLDDLRSREGILWVKAVSVEA